MKHPVFPTSILIILVYVALALPFSSCEPDPGLPSTDSIVSVDSLPYGFIYNTYTIDSWLCAMTGISDTAYQLNIAQDSTNLNQVIISNFANTENQMVGVINSTNTTDSIFIIIQPQYVFFPNYITPSILDSTRFWGYLSIFPDSIIFVHHYDVINENVESCISFGHPQ